MKFIGSLFLIASLMLAGCSGEEKETVQETKAEGKEEKGEESLSKKEKQELIYDYINADVKKVSDYEMKAMTIIQEVTSDPAVDPQTIYDAFVNEVIPTYEKAVKEAKSIEPPLEELEPLHEMVEKASGLYLEALKLEVESADTGDAALKEKANDKMEEYSEVLKSYHSEMEKLAKKYDLDYEQRTFEGAE